MSPGFDRRRFLIGGAWAGGALALGLGGCTDETPIDHPAKPAGHAVVPDPLDFLVTRWGTDPWTRGAWSSLRPSAGPDPRVVLGRPLLDFSGEHGFENRRFAAA